jgi:hypothetical protein
VAQTKAFRVGSDRRSAGILARLERADPPANAGGSNTTGGLKILRESASFSGRLIIAQQFTAGIRRRGSKSVKRTAEEEAQSQP